MISKGRIAEWYSCKKYKSEARFRVETGFLMLESTRVTSLLVRAIALPARYRPLNN